MSGVLGSSRKRWSVLTVVLAAIAVIAAMVVVPQGQANAEGINQLILSLMRPWVM